MDYQAAVKGIADSGNSKGNKYLRWSESEKFEIGKYAAENGASNAARKFTTKSKPLSESTARRFS